MAINSLNNVSSASKGLSGLMSGMDTQSMVDAMLSGTQAKIDKQKAAKTILGYKQSFYRDTISSMKGFQDNFFKWGSNSGNNMLNSAFYNTMSAAYTSKYFKVNAGSTAALGKTTINGIEKLAQALKLRSSLTETTAKVEGKLDLSKLSDEGIDGDLIVELDGVRKTIKLPTDATTEQEFVDKLNAAITHSFGNGVSASYDSNSGKISFNAADDSRQFIIMGNQSAMGALGIKTGTSNKINTNMLLRDINFAQKLDGSEFKFKINGVEFAVNENESLSSIIGKINNSDANVKVRYSAIEDKFSIESTVSGEGTDIVMSQSEGNLLTAMFGTGTGGAVTGDVTYSYGDMAGKLLGMPDVSGLPADEAKTKIDEAIVKLNESLNKYMDTGLGKFSITVNGQKIEITVPQKDLIDPPDPAHPDKREPYTVDDIVGAFNDNQELKDLGVKLSIKNSAGEYTGKAEMTIKPGTGVIAGDGFDMFGMSGGTGHNEKIATEDSTLESMGLSGTEVTIGGVTIKAGNIIRPDGGPTRLSDLISAMEGELKQQATDAGQTAEQVGAIKVEVLKAPPGSEGKIRIFGVDIPVTIAITGDNGKLMGTDRIELNSTGTAIDRVTEGQNAVLYVNGERVERSSNEFTLEGLSFELKEVFNADYANNPTDVSKFESIDVTRDTDQIFDGVVKFMDEYNKLVDKVWGLLKAEPNYKDYPPLTDKQKQSMSDKEVELWEKKSQEGIMRSDDTLEAIMETMRQVLTRKPAGSKYSLADMGITTSYDFETGIGGKLVFNDTAKTGEKLKEMITQEPEALEALLSNSETGILPELNRVMEGATRVSGKGDTYGHLSIVDISGGNAADTSSRMYKEGRDIDSNLENLKRKYETEYQRYWKQFNSMEQMINQMNQQSSWLSQQLGG